MDGSLVVNTDVAELLIERVEKLQLHFDKRLDRIESKQDLTNGRVNELERERDHRKGYEARRSEETVQSWEWRRIVVPAVVAFLVAMLVVVLAHVWPLPT